MIRAEYPLSLGGTDIAAVLGLHPHRSPIDVWLDCRGESEHTEADLDTAPWLVLGDAYEQPIALLFGGRHPELGGSVDPGSEPLPAVEGGAYDQLAAPENHHHRYRLQSVEHAWLGGTPDRLYPARPDVLTEIKTADPSQLGRGQWGDAGSDLVPVHYALQVQGYMLLTGARVAYLAAAFGGRAYREYTIAADADLHAMISEECSRWWSRHVVANGVQPDIDASASWRSYALRRWPRAVVDVREATEQEIADARLYAEISAEIKTLETAKAAVANRLIVNIADGAGIELAPKKRVTYPEVAGSVSWKDAAHDLAREHGIDIAALQERYRGKPSRRLMMPRNWT